MAAPDAPPLRYVALGDSYTIGTAVDPGQGWPSRLVRALVGGATRGGLELVANLGVNGYTSADVINDELPELDRLRPEFASLLIGVNDVVRGTSLAAYGANLEQIFGALLAQLAPTRILTIATTA